MRHLYRAFCAPLFCVVLACGITKPPASPGAAGSAGAGMSGGTGASGAAGAAGGAGTNGSTGTSDVTGAGGVTCDNGRNAYVAFRDQLIAADGSTSCDADTDCSILYEGFSVCEPSCRLIAQSSAGAQRIHQDMSAFPVHEECGTCDDNFSWPLCGSRTVSCVDHV